MEMIDTNKLVPHERNTYFFDDMVGEPWMAFLESIESSGIVEPIIATQDLVIVSGHQRVRAAKALKIKKVKVEVVNYDSDDEILKQLIETNIRQRGIGNTNAVKLGRCIAELERIYGIRNGNNQHTERDGNNFQPTKTQDDLAEELGMSKRQMTNYKSLTKLIPELQDAVMSGQITPTTAMGFVKKLSPEEQKQLAEQIAGKEKVSSAEIQKYIDENAKLRKALSESEAKRIAAEKNKKEVIKEVEVVPEDYEDLKDKASRVDGYKKDYQTMRKQYEEMSDKWKKSESEKQAIIDELHKPENEKAESIKRSAMSFCAGVSNFIEKYGGYVWLTQEIDNMDSKEREGYLRAVSAMDAWVFQMKKGFEEN